jgi:predicted RNA polymerase sigma factor
VRRYGHFDMCEDAVQEALLAAAVQWPDQGVPARPRGWLITVAARRLTDQWRSDQARQRREATVAAQVPPDETFAPGPGDDERPPDHDDALTLRAVGGLTTAQIALAFLVPEATMAQRISRAKQRIKQAGIPFGLHRSRSGPSGCGWCCRCCT